MDHHFYQAGAIVPPPALPSNNYVRRYHQGPLVPPALPLPHYTHAQPLPAHPPPHLHQPHPVQHRSPSPHVPPSHQPIHPHIAATQSVQPSLTHVSPPTQIPSPPHRQAHSSPQFQPHAQAQLQLQLQPQLQSQPLIVSSHPQPTSPITSHGMTAFRPPLPWLSAPGEPFPPRKPKRRRKPPVPTPHPPHLEPQPSDPFQQSLPLVISALPESITSDEKEITMVAPEKDTTIVVSDKEAKDFISDSDQKELILGEDKTDNVSEKEAKDVIETEEVKDATTREEIGNVVPVKETDDAQKPAASKHQNAPSVSSACKAVNPPPAVPLIPISTTSARKTVPLPVQKEAVKEESKETLIEAPKSSENAPKELPEALPEAPPPPPTAPVASHVDRSWAGVVKSSPAKGLGTVAQPKINGSASFGKASSLEGVLKNFEVASVLNFHRPVLEPRGLINTGNMCYMNAILQMLMFCGPFYSFLDLVGKQVAHNFKGNTPLIDAMVLFLREFRTLNSKSSPILEKDYLEALGEPFVPEFVYAALRDLQRFSSMRRGHQHDAEEFLGFLLDELHEETLRVSQTRESVQVPPPNPSSTSEDGWLEVGPKQKVASTRTTITPDSPITKIFGGLLRSEFRVPGVKPSVTLEPYQPLQLDIQSAQVWNIVDALKQLTKPETIHGEFSSPRGPNVTATKQVFIETLPPVLILHLKRFQYDNKGGTQKIWKKIGYPLILDIPKEAFSPTKRNVVTPKYRLIGVVYHHGKSASGGHYTVDVLRQDGKHWIRFDDTVIKRVHSDEVKVDVKEKGTGSSTIEADDGGGWKSVNGNGISTAVNGNSSTGTTDNFYGKDGKVAYILFFQRI